jgi:hypothetical protein
MGRNYLGDEAFADRMKTAMAAASPAKTETARDIPKRQRLPTRIWAHCLDECQGERDAALLLGYRQYGLTMTLLAQAAGVSVSRVSREVGRQEREARA